MARGPVLDGVARALTLAPGIAPLGALFGAAAVTAGFSPAAAVALSAIVFAGGAQFAAVGLVAAQAAFGAAVALVGVINARYFLLSAATLELARPQRPPAVARVALALGTVDESYALQAAWAAKARAPLAGLLVVPATLWTLWVASTAVGAFLGARLPDVAPLGLDYALPGIFVGLLGIFADTRARLAAGLAALAVAGALALAGLGVAAVLLVPPAFAFALGRWARAG